MTLSRGEALAPVKTAVRYRFVVPQLCVVGSLPELGGWAPQQAPAMMWHEGHQWALEVALPQESFEFKIVVAEGGVVKWEGGSNRVIQTDEGEGNVPVEIVVWLTCHFNATASTQLQLAVPRGSVQGAYETSKATLEFLRRRRSKLGQDAEQADSSAERQRQAVELLRLAEAVAEQSSSVAELGSLLGREEPPGRARAKWAAARAAEGGEEGAHHANGRVLPAASPSPHHLQPLAALSGSEQEDESDLLLLAIDSVRLPRALRRIAFANVVEAWNEGARGGEAGGMRSPLSLSSPGASSTASADGAPSAPAPSPFLRGELDSRAEELMSAAGVLLQEMRAAEEPDAERRSSLASLAEEAGHVAGALAQLGGGSAGSRATLAQLEGLASVGGALAAGAAGGTEEAVVAAEAEVGHVLAAAGAEERASLVVVDGLQAAAVMPAAAEAVEAVAAGGNGFVSNAAADGLPPLLAELPATASAHGATDSVAAASEAAEPTVKSWQRAASAIKGQLAGLGALALLLVAAAKVAAKLAL
ncbi:hypothetical protein TSOC_007422 [Tetrabaena socialis]|uniref:CBM20 domain-containing protein n=1 Tax=Tetrabaena socialis TaxID=47790 RepID=A0A2J8A142_9CHLO|nr:hypothetical protein TSOC_007422 [Tetrabaena socialis]|eukprot:PNH06243.1 hypothetical protein TSOC_007422 [Tetrabaena socialis]